MNDPDADELRHRGELQEGHRRRSRATATGKELARVVTFVAPPSRAPYGGINNAIINATSSISDYEPSRTRGDGDALERAEPEPQDTTDSTGTVSFAALTPNPTSGAQSYYDLTVAGPGYETLPTDMPPGTATPPATSSHIQLAPSQTSTTSIQIFKPATINARSPVRREPLHRRRHAEGLSSFTGATTHDQRAGRPELEDDHDARRRDSRSRAPPTRFKATRRAASARRRAPSPVPASGYPGTRRRRSRSTSQRARRATSRQRQAARRQRRRRPRHAHRRPERHHDDGHDRCGGNAVFTTFPSGSGLHRSTSGRGSGQTRLGLDVRRHGNARRTRRSSLPNPPTTTVTVNVSARRASSSAPGSRSLSPAAAAGWSHQTANTVSGVAHVHERADRHRLRPRARADTAQVVSYVTARAARHGDRVT